QLEPGEKKLGAGANWGPAPRREVELSQRSRGGEVLQESRHIASCDLRLARIRCAGLLHDPRATWGIVAHEGQWYPQAERRGPHPPHHGVCSRIVFLAHGEVPHGSYGSEEARVEGENLVEQLACLSAGAATKRIVVVQNIGELEQCFQTVGVTAKNRAIFSSRTVPRPPP